MQGTEKQIKWAEEIRAAALTTLDAIIASAEAAAAAKAAKGCGKVAQSLLADVELVKPSISTLAAIDDASWWIDRRQFDAAALVGFALHSDAIIGIINSIDCRNYTVA